MEDFSSGLDGNVTDLTTSIRSLLPELIFKMDVRGDRQAIEVLSAEAQFCFEFPETEKRVYLNHVNVPTANIEPIRQRGTNVTALLPLTTTELERIEELRKGGEIESEIEITFQGFRGNSDDIQRGSLSIDYTIRTSEWNDILSKIGYHDNREFLMNLGAEDTVVRDVLTSVQSQLRRAERTHNDGDYPNAIQTCRRVIESLQQIDDELMDLVDEQKWDDFEGSMGQFEKGFVGTLCHSEDKTNVEPPLKRDSDFVLGLTKSYVRFISQTVSEEM